MFKASRKIRIFLGTGLMILILLPQARAEIVSDQI
jgi:hypothetical protein